ncbi:MAG: hypothetical protein ACLGHL_02560 [Actinomycetota bacterium]
MAGGSAADRYAGTVCEHGGMSGSATISTTADWGLSPSPAGPVTAFIVPGIVSAAVLVVLGTLVSWMVGLLVGALVLFGWTTAILTAGKRLLRSVKARPPKDEEAARVRNILEGLAPEGPALWVIDDERPNALVAWSGGPHIAVTTGLTTGFTRTETEAVVAHCLARIRSGEARTTTYLGGALLPKPLQVGIPHDVSAAALTRYPPGLAAALGKCVPLRSGWSYAWLVGEPPSHLATAERIAALGDL